MMEKEKLGCVRLSNTIGVLLVMIAIIGMGTLNYAGGNGNVKTRSNDPPTLVSPTDGDTMTDTTPSYDWESVSLADEYQIQVDDSSSFSSPSIDRETSNSYLTPYTSLEGKYYWHVRTKDNNEWGSWSEMWEFLVIVPPALQSPGDSASISDTTPQFIWLSVEGATKYKIQVGESGGSSTIDAISETTSYTSSTTLDYTDYYWRVKSFANDVWSDWSISWDFTVDAPTVSPPTLIFPSNGDIISDTTPTFDWSDITGAEKYQIQIDDSTDPSYYPQINKETSNSEFTPTSSLSFETYYWHVRTQDNDVWSEWSSIYSFTIEEEVILPPPLISPTNEESITNTEPFFDWGDINGADEYEIEIAESSSFSWSVIDTKVIKSDYTSSRTLDYIKYFWRVKVEVNAVWSGWSSTWSFTITEPIVSTPTLSSPSNGETITDTTHYFDWGTVLGAEKYQIQIDDSTTFSSPVIDKTTTSSDYTSTKTLSYKTYYWHVKAQNDEIWSDWSSAWSFTVSKTVSPVIAPSLISPKDGTAISDTTPSFDWDTVTGAEKYQIQIDDSTTFSYPNIEETTTSSDYTTTKILDYTTYYWRVRTQENGGWSDWSQIWCFNIEKSNGGTTPSGSSYSLYDAAITHGYISAYIQGVYSGYGTSFTLSNGNGVFYGKCIELKVESEVQKTLQIKVELNRLLTSKEYGVQDMIITEDFTFSLKSKATETITLNAMCYEMHENSPIKGIYFDLASKAMGNVVKVISEISEKKLQDASGQCALWAVTDNAKEDELKAMGATDYQINEAQSILNNANVNVQLKSQISPTNDPIGSDDDYSDDESINDFDSDYYIPLYIAVAVFIFIIIIVIIMRSTKKSKKKPNISRETERSLDRRQRSASFLRSSPKEDDLKSRKDRIMPKRHHDDSRKMGSGYVLDQNDSTKEFVFPKHRYSDEENWADDEDWEFYDNSNEDNWVDEEDWEFYDDANKDDWVDEEDQKFDSYLENIKSRVKKLHEITDARFKEARSLGINITRYKEDYETAIFYYNKAEHDLAVERFSTVKRELDKAIIEKKKEKLKIDLKNIAE